MKYLWLWLSLVGLLAGCSAPLKSDLPNEQVYRLAPVVDIAARRLPLTLYVPPLTAHPHWIPHGLA